MPLTSTWQTIDGLALHARVDESSAPAGAPSIVLVHGLGVSSRYMLPLARLLAPHLKVYAPDLPGFGRSQKPPRPLSMDGLCEALDHWLRASGLERTALLGNSLGCELIVQLAQHQPQLVERAVLVGPTDPPGWRSVPRQMLRAALDIPLERPTLWPGLLYDYLRAGPLRVVRTLQSMLEHRIEDRLPLVTAPTLVIRGERDPIISQAWAEQVARLLPRGTLVIIPRGSHATHYTNAETVAAVVRAFILI